MRVPSGPAQLPTSSGEKHKPTQSAGSKPRWIPEPTCEIGGIGQSRNGHRGAPSFSQERERTGAPLFSARKTIYGSMITPGDDPPVASWSLTYTSYNTRPGAASPLTLAVAVSPSTTRSSKHVRKIQLQSVAVAYHLPGDFLSWETQVCGRRRLPNPRARMTVELGGPAR